MNPKILPLALISIVDAMSFMIVAPSILFYILDLHGTHHWYGLILSIYSFSSFSCKPFLGHITDIYGFRLPYLVCFGLASIGGLFYTFASISGPYAMYVLLLSRILAGVGGGSSTVGFAYIARTLPPDKRTAATTLLSTTRTVSMAMVPSLNFFLQTIHYKLYGFTLNSYNVVGLVILLENLVLISIVYWTLHEPDIREKLSTKKKVQKIQMIKSILGDPQIIVPFVTIYTLNACFQLIETALAPASHHALNWEPYQISVILSIMCIFLFLTMVTVITVSQKKLMKDYSLLKIGLILQGIGYGSIYICWTHPAKSWQFIVPNIIAVCSFALLGGPNRSLFTLAIEKNTVLQEHSGTMQSLLGMAASVAGFTAPGFTASMVVKKNSYEEILSYEHEVTRELTVWALLAPIMTCICLVLVLLTGEPISQGEKLEIDGEDVEKNIQPMETTKLLDKKKNCQV